MNGFIYLHGFASSPGSRKAEVFKERFARNSCELIVPDLNGEDFTRMTLSSQIGLVENVLNNRREQQFGLIGSSMGGYLSALLAEVHHKVAALYLMAPGFNFLARWKEALSQDPGAGLVGGDLIRVFHYRYNEERDLSTDIFRDAERWDALPLVREVPTRIVHGINDDTVPVEESRQFVKDRPWRRLKELNADHGLVDEVDWIVEDCLQFFRGEKLL